jgi:uncharacterized damage-inducible protein DinB
MMNGYRDQYEWVRKTRELLFSYCETLDRADYIQQIEGFGGGSIRDLHVHVAECYGFWLGQFCIEESGGLGKFEQPQTVSDIRHIFKKVDTCVDEFFRNFEEKWETPISGRVRWQAELFVVTPLWLYTHAMTHEFHHKGQIVSMSRTLGYVPVDTDLIAPE